MRESPRFRSCSSSYERGARVVATIPMRTGNSARGTAKGNRFADTLAGALETVTSSAADHALGRVQRSRSARTKGRLEPLFIDGRSFIEPQRLPARMRNRPLRASKHDAIRGVESPRRSAAASTGGAPWPEVALRFMEEIYPSAAASPAPALVRSARPGGRHVPLERRRSGERGLRSWTWEVPCRTKWNIRGRLVAVRERPAVIDFRHATACMC